MVAVVARNRRKVSEMIKMSKKPFTRCSCEEGYCGLKAVVILNLPGKNDVLEYRFCTKHLFMINQVLRVFFPEALTEAVVK